MKTEKYDFGITRKGLKADIIRISNNDGSSVSLTNYGATIISIVVPDNKGNMVDVCLGYRTLEEYETRKDFFGATIGRCANRIRKGQFSLDGKNYCLTTNEGQNHLHGGHKGFDKQLFDYAVEDDAVLFAYQSPDGEEGYPGDLGVRVRFSFSEDHTLQIVYEAECNKDTIVNLTNHTYFNLNGEGNGDILKHKLKLYASQYTEIDEQYIPTGRNAAVAGNPFDFTSAVEIGKRIDIVDEQLKNGNGYDHNFVLDSIESVKQCAELSGDISGIKLSIFTTKPGVQFYSGNMMSNTSGKSGTYKKRNGVCLETQYFPDAINHPDFLAPILKKGEKYVHATTYKFSE